YPEALLQALDNIIGNACKYSANGEIVEVSTLARELSVVVTVRDHGPGVDDEEMSKLSQPFYRAGNQMHTNGFGLGLSIAVKAINKHNGELRMSSPDDGGLCVEIILPRTLP
ncbi:MAG: sensor histidine kinase, partial [Paraglaciecola polaris]|uniref:sensor histidine kinase n=1 Tax=Paraglaciecola polaris TaxID=222814 RepID=UPI0030010BB6